MISDTLRWVFWSLEVFYMSFFLGSLLLFYLIQYWKIRHHPVLAKRNVRVVLLLNILIMIQVSIAQPLLSAEYGLPISHMSMVVIRTLRRIIYVIVPHAILIILIMRYWHLYCNVHFALAAEKMEWIQHINNQCQSTNWFINNTKLWSWSYMRKWGFGIYAIHVVILGYIFFTAKPETIMMVDNLLYIIKTLTFVILWFKTPDYEDQLMIREGYRRVIWVIIVAEVTYLLLAVGMMAGAYNMYILLFVGALFWQTGWALMGLITTRWVMKCGVLQLQNAHITYLLNYLSGDEPTELSTTKTTDPSNARHRSETTAVLPISVVLADRKGFETVMFHLYQEFSSENLLAVLELTQFQKICLEVHRTATMSDADTSVGGVSSASLVNDATIDFDENLPMLKIVRLPGDDDMKSSIVYNKDLSIPEKSYQLISKYILVGSPFQVNLSYRCRNGLEQMIKYQTMDEMDGEALSRVFERAISEIMLILRDSYRRLRGTPEYEDLERYFDERKRKQTNKDGTLKVTG